MDAAIVQVTNASWKVDFPGTVDKSWPHNETRSNASGLAGPGKGRRFKNLFPTIYFTSSQEWLVANMILLVGNEGLADAADEHAARSHNEEINADGLIGIEQK